MTDLPALLERVEAASGADAELSARVLCALLAPPTAFVEQSRINLVWCIYETSARGQRLFDGLPANLRLADVTASLDAAVALVEAKMPGAIWDVSNGADDGGTGPWGAVGTVACMGDTPVLGLIAALLRAMIAEKEKTDVSSLADRD